MCDDNAHHTGLKTDPLIQQIFQTVWNTHCTTGLLTQHHCMTLMTLLWLNRRIAPIMLQSLSRKGGYYYSKEGLDMESEWDSNFWPYTVHCIHTRASDNEIMGILLANSLMCS